jgi:hypothetical protein
MLRFLIASILVGLSMQQQKDPLKDFCRRFGHQTTVIDRKYVRVMHGRGNRLLTDHRLYIDGGLINYSPFNSDPSNHTNPLLLYADLDVNNTGMPQEFANLSKPSSAPSVAGGILWEDSVNKVEPTHSRMKKP